MFPNMPNNGPLTRIGVFYDGNYFLHVSNYYHYVHERHSRISIGGLHEFIRHEVGQAESKDVRHCQIVDAHYFRGRLSASEASQRGNLLYYERVFDDILMGEGVVTHYLPIKIINGRRQEKGIDVWFALEAYELTVLKKFDIVVIVSSDSDYVPLVRKLNALGTRIMLISWDFEYTDEEGHRYSTRTSQELLEEVTYTVPMHEIIDNRARRNDPVINRLFVPKAPDKDHARRAPVRPSDLVNLADMEIRQLDDGRFESYILSLKDGYGFIKYPPDNVFFHFSSLVDFDFNDLRVGDLVEFVLDTKEDGRLIADEVVVLEE